MDMKKILQVLDKPAPKKSEGSSDMKRLLQIMEGNNRLSQAENIIVQEQERKNITNPVLNVDKHAKPNMIGKYFRTVETELSESQKHKEDHVAKLAKRVTERVMPKDDGTFTPSFAQSMAKDVGGFAPSGNVQSQATVILGGKEYRVVLQGDLRGRYSPGPGTPRVSAQGYIEGDVITLTINPPTDMKEGLKDPKDNPCWKGYKPVGTKKKGGRTVPNCVPKE